MINNVLVKVTVIIPNYNHALYLAQRIDSVLNQTYQNTEVLLLDDCSSDSSRDIIAQYANADSRIRVVLNEHNSGSTFKQWNKGIALAQGKYIWLAESDDWAEPTFLQELVSRLESDPQIVVAYSNSFDVDENSAVNGTWAWFLEDLDLMWAKDFVADGLALVRRFMSLRNFIPNASAVVIRADTLRKVGPAEESFKVLGDWLFWAKLLSRGKVAYVAKPLNYFRTHSNNARSKNYLNGTGLEENSRVLVAMQQYGTPDPVFYKKAVGSILELWYYGLFYLNIPLQRHLAIYRNVASIEPGFAKQVLATVVKKFFYKGSGFRILLGDKLLYRILKK